MKRWLMSLLAVVPLAAGAAPARPTRPLTAKALMLTEWHKARTAVSARPLPSPGRPRWGQGEAGKFQRRLGGSLRSAGSAQRLWRGGSGSAPGDEAPIGDQREALAAQWPYVRAKPLTTANPEGRGEILLAYVRVPGQRCLYNVWSRLGRRHPELLLDSLRPVPAGS